MEGCQKGLKAVENCPEDPRFECPICLSWLRDPVLTSCGHRFCRDCISSWMQKNSKFCPVDNKPLKSDTDLFPDNFTRREILQQKTKCPFRAQGCSAELSPLEMDDHVQTCAFGQAEDEVECPLKKAGCEEKFNSQSEAEAHLAMNICQHMALLSNALTKPQPAPSAMAEEANFWDPPQKDESSAQTAKEPNQITGLMRALYEKIVVLEQKNREQEIIIANMSQQLADNNSFISDIPQRFCNGNYVWVLKEFKLKLAMMKSDLNQIYYSPGIYTAMFGYKFCVRVNLVSRNGYYLALLVHVMKTDHDDSLEWPFNGKIQLTLIHPKDQSKNLKETLMTPNSLECFKRTVQNINYKGFGYTEFISEDDLTQNGYISTDELKIRVLVQQV